MSALAGEDRRDHLGHEPRVVLVVGVDHHDHVGAVAQRAHVAGLLAAAVAAVGRVAEHVEAVRERDRGRVVGLASSTSSARSAASTGISARRRRGSCASPCRRAARRDDRRAPAAVAQQRLGAARCTSMRWARITRSSPSDEAQRGAGGQRVGQPRRAARPRGPSRSARPATQRRAENVRTSGTSVGDHQAAGGEQLAQRRGAAAGTCGRARSPTSAAPAMRGRRRRRVRRHDAQHAAGAQQRARSASIAVDRVVEVLDARRRARRRRSPARRRCRRRPRAASSRTSRPSASRAWPRRRARELEADGLVAARARLVEQQPVPAADVEQPARRRRARR